MSASADGFFATTRWTVVRAAGQAASPLADQALESLCAAYWFPLYAYVRRHGFSKEDAEDLTQAFFAKLLARQDFAGLNQENGRFRAFLLAALKNFLANERDRAGRLKRGGNITHFSLDWQSADSRFQIADGGQIPPDAAYDREWTLALLERVLVRLRGESVAAGKRSKVRASQDLSLRRQGRDPVCVRRSGAGAGRGRGAGGGAPVAQALSRAVAQRGRPNTLRSGDGGGGVGGAARRVRMSWR